MTWAMDEQDIPLGVVAHCRRKRRSIRPLEPDGTPRDRLLPILDDLEPLASISVRMLAAFEAYAAGDIATATEYEILADRAAASLDVARAAPRASPRVRAELLPQHASRRAVATLRDNRSNSAVPACPSPTSRSFLQPRAVPLPTRRRLRARQRLRPKVRAARCRLAQPDLDARWRCSRSPRSPHATTPTERLTRSNAASSTATTAPPSAPADRVHERLILARRRRRGGSSSKAARVSRAWRRGSNPRARLRVGYAIEILTLLGDLRGAAILDLGAVLDGELQALRQVPLPPDRSVPSACV